MQRAAKAWPGVTAMGFTHACLVGPRINKNFSS